MRGMRTDGPTAMKYFGRAVLDEWEEEDQAFCDEVERQADKWAELQRHLLFYKCLNKSKGPYCE